MHNLLITLIVLYSIDIFFRSINICIDNLPKKTMFVYRFDGICNFCILVWMLILLFQ